MNFYYEPSQQDFSNNLVNSERTENIWNNSHLSNNCELSNNQLSYIDEYVNIPEDQKQLETNYAYEYQNYVEAESPSNLIKIDENGYYLYDYPNQLNQSNYIDNYVDYQPEMDIHSNNYLFDNQNETISPKISQNKDMNSQIISHNLNLTTESQNFFPETDQTKYFFQLIFIFLKIYF